MASGLSCAVGFKNSTDGSLDAALNALKSASSPHRFLGLSSSGEVAVFHTRGNPNAHIVLRGGHDGPNYDAASISKCEQGIRSAGHEPAIMVDCRHANSNKDHTQQPAVALNVAEQIRSGNHSIIGLMLESNIAAGQQSIASIEEMAYGVSVTDACIGWEDTETLLREVAARVSGNLQRRVA